MLCSVRKIDFFLGIHHRSNLILRAPYSGFVSRSFWYNVDSLYCSESTEFMSSRSVIISQFDNQ